MKKSKKYLTAMKEKIINFINRSYNSIQIAYLNLKMRYRISVKFTITGNKNGYLQGYFTVR